MPSSSRISLIGLYVDHTHTHGLRLIESELSFFLPTGVRHHRSPERRKTCSYTDHHFVQGNRIEKEENNQWCQNDEELSFS